MTLIQHLYYHIKDYYKDKGHNYVFTGKIIQISTLFA